MLFAYTSPSAEVVRFAPESRLRDKVVRSRTAVLLGDYSWAIGEAERANLGISEVVRVFENNQEWVPDPGVLAEDLQGEILVFLPRGYRVPDANASRYGFSSSFQGGHGSPSPSFCSCYTLSESSIESECAFRCRRRRVWRPWPFYEKPIAVLAAGKDGRPGEPSLFMRYFFEVIQTPGLTVQAVSEEIQRRMLADPKRAPGQVPIFLSPSGPLFVVNQTKQPTKP